MKALSGAPLVLIFHALICVPSHISAQNIQDVTQAHSVSPSNSTWKSTKAEHVYGFPDIKPNKKGTLTLDADALTFSSKSGNTSIRRSSLTSASAGNQRVEMWGIGGRILRMTIPDGGGLAAAAFMHHRVDMLTVEFNDDRGAAHSAVFFLPANEATRALPSFALAPPVPTQPRMTSENACQHAPAEANSVLLASPSWTQAEVPAAYRSLVYEHMIDRLRLAKGVGHVYRDGENNGQTACPQYMIHIAIATFKEGSSVKRAFMGPVGMFVGTTQIRFDVTYTDASGTMNVQEQIKATIRGESESTNVADHVAKNLAKQYGNVLKNANKSGSAKSTINATS
jgi:hypothetical protein